MPSDHWYAEVFRALPDLVRHLLPGLAPGPRDSDTAYMFRPVALKKVAHHPDGVLWPRDHPGGSRELPVVLHEEVEHLQVLVLLAHRRLALGNRQPSLLRRFLKHDVTWVDLSAMACWWPLRWQRARLARVAGKSAGLNALADSRLFWSFHQSAGSPCGGSTWLRRKPIFQL